MHDVRAHADENADRRIDVDVFHKRLSSSLDPAWPEPTIGAAGTLGATAHRGWRVPAVGYPDFIHPPPGQIARAPVISHLETLARQITLHGVSPRVRHRP